MNHRLHGPVVFVLLIVVLSPASASAQLVISEFRYFGPIASADGYIEIHNNTPYPHKVSSKAPSTGYIVLPSDLIDGCVIPNGTVIPAGGHFLCVAYLSGRIYTLRDYPAGNGTTAFPDATYGGVPNSAGIAIFNSTIPSRWTLANRIDAVGTTAEPNSLFKEGAGLPAIPEVTINYAWVRDRCGKGGAIATPGPCPSGGFVVDTGANASDFHFVDPNRNFGGESGPVRLGAPGPENLSSPRFGGGAISDAPLDPCVNADQAPNVLRDYTSGPWLSTCLFGTMDIHRTFTNQSNAPITRLRLRIVDLTTYPAPRGVADLRALTSKDTVVTVHGSACMEGAASIAVSGTKVEMPPKQEAYGGGFNSSLSVDAVTAATPLLPGASIPVHVLFGVQQTGDYRIGLIAEGLPDGGQQVLEIHGATNLTTGVPLVTSIVRARHDPADAFADVAYTVTFNGDVDGVDPTDFVLVTNYPGTGAVITGVTGSGSTRTVHVNAGAGGTVRLDLIDDDSIVSNGVPLGGAGAGNATFRSGEEYTVDVPRVVSVTRAGPSPTSAQTVEFNVRFSETVDGTYTQDFTITPLVAGGAIDGNWGVYGTGIMSVTGSGATRTVTAYTGTGDGDIRVDVLDRNVIIDRYGIPLNGLASNDPYTQGESYTVEHPPRVLDSRSTGFDEPRGLVQYAVRFSEPVSGVDAADFKITATGSAAGTIVDIHPLLSPLPPWTLVVTVKIHARGGTLRLDVADSATLTDRNGHGLEYAFADGEPFVIPTVANANVPMLGDVALMVLAAALAAGALLRSKGL